MPSDSVASFLDLARENRLLPADEVQELVRRSEVPEAGLPAFCDALVSRGLLTPFQADQIRRGRGQALAFAGYPIVDDLGPCPGGTAQRATHPSLRTPVVLRRLNTDWLAPADNLPAYVQRARQASTVTHPHLATILEAGASEDQLFVALEPVAGADLDGLVRDIGPMPAFLACRFAGQAAAGLAAAHAAGVVHGDVRPAVLFVGPLAESSRKKADGSPLVRPTPEAAATVTELGLVPRRPAAEGSAYLPPERRTSGDPTPAGDVYGLGLSLGYLLTGRTPDHGPPPLGVLRPDLPADLTAFVAAMTATDPTSRPSMAVAAERLAGFASPTAAPVPAEPPVELKSVEPVALKPAAGSAGWEVQPYDGSVGDGEVLFAPPAAAEPEAADDDDSTAFAAASAPTTPAVRRRAMSDEEAKKVKKKWMLIAAGLWVISIPLWIILLYQWGVLGGSTPPTKPQQSQPAPKPAGGPTRTGTPQRP